MSINNEHAKELQRITADLGDLVQQMRPGTVKEWDIFDGAVTAHKHLRKLDTDSLRQYPLPLGELTELPALSIDEQPELPLIPTEEQPELYYTIKSDCPKCKGTGFYQEIVKGKGVSRDCPCYDISPEAWPGILKEWEEALQPVEA